jgi:hypothetical protein
VGRSGDDGGWVGRLAKVFSGDRCPLGFSGDRLGRLTLPGEDDCVAGMGWGNASPSSAMASASASDELDEIDGDSGRMLDR